MRNDPAPGHVLLYRHGAYEGFQQDTKLELKQCSGITFTMDIGSIWACHPDLNGDNYPDFVKYSTPWGGSTHKSSYLILSKILDTTGNWQFNMQAYFPAGLTVI